MNTIIVTIIFQIILFFIALAVTIGLSKGKNMWWVILTYWFFLTLKNFSDLLMGAMK